MRSHNFGTQALQSGVIVASMLVFFGCDDQIVDRSEAAEPGSQTQAQEPTVPERSTHMPEAEEPTPPEDPQDWVTNCMMTPVEGPELSPTADACDPNASAGSTNLYGDYDAIQSMRGCEAEPVASRRAYEMLQIDDAVLADWPAEQDTLAVALPHPGVRLLVRAYLMDGQTRCGDLPLHDFWLGDGRERPGESVSGQVILARVDGRLQARTSLSYVVQLGWPEAGPSMSVSTGFVGQPLD